MAGVLRKVVEIDRDCACECEHALFEVEGAHDGELLARRGGDGCHTVGDGLDLGYGGLVGGGGSCLDDVLRTLGGFIVCHSKVDYVLTGVGEDFAAEADEVTVDECKGF